MLCSAGFAIADGADAEKQIAAQIAKRRRFVIIRKPLYSDSNGNAIIFDFYC
jgi:hypothetical protein